MTDKIVKRLLILIFILALVLRVHDLATFPANFHFDEVFNTYVGRYILTNLKDPYGNFFPLLYFDLRGDYPPTFPMYFSGIATFIFGINEFSARIPFALFGAFTVFPIYLFTDLLFKNKRISLLSALFIAILPWHLVLSRASAESIAGTTVLLFGLYLLFKSILENKVRLLWVACLLLFLTYFIYPSFRVLTPLTLLPLPFLFYKSKFKKSLIGIVIFSFLLTLFISSTTWGKGRFVQTSIFTNPTIVFAINNNNTSLYGDETSIYIARIFHNKFVGYTKEFIKQYLSYFSTDYLFLKGGYPIKYSVRDTGLLYLSFIVFYLGLLLPRWKNFNNKYLFYLIYLLFISVIPAALTADDIPNVKRAVFMAVPLVILAGIGFENIVMSMKNKSKIMFLVILTVVIMVSGEFIFFWHQHSQHNGSNKSILMNDGDREVSKYILAHKNEYTKIYAPAYLIMEYLFFKNDFTSRPFAYGMIINCIDNIMFVNTGDKCYVDKLIEKRKEKNVLYIEDGDCAYPKELSTLDIIRRKDTTRAYLLLKSF